MNGMSAEGASALRTTRRTVRVEVQIPEAAAAEFELMMRKLFAGKRDRALGLECERATELRGLDAAFSASFRLRSGIGESRRAAGTRTSRAETSFVTR